MTIKLKEKYQVLPSMDDIQFRALKADIAERGVLTPIDVDEQGYILDGHHRYRACVELGITNFPTILRLNMDESEKRMFARKSNMLRRHLNQEQMREIISGQLKDTPNWANNRIAQELGVDSKTVAAVREKLEATLEIPKFDRLLGADGKERPVKQRKPSIMIANDADLAKAISQALNNVCGEGFAAMKDGVFTIIDHNYNPTYGLTKEEIDQWDCFGHFLEDKCGWVNDGSIGSHIEWLRDKDFKTPDEWLGPEGEKFCTAWGKKKQNMKLKASWNEYKKSHDVTFYPKQQEVIEAIV